MNRSTLPTGIKTLKNWNDKQTLKFDLPIQRNSGMWNLLQKSMLVYSILNEYPVPSLYLAKYKNDSETIYQAIDGKQRCTSLFEFINGDYALHPKTPPVEVDGTVFDIAGLTFEELSDDCKDALLGFRFTIYCLEDATDEQIEEIFELINNATPLSTIQKSKAKIGTELSKFLSNVLQLNFWQESVNLTVAQMRREDNLLLLLQSALLLNMQISDYDFKSISAAECLKFCEHLRSDFPNELKEQLENITIYLSDAFEGKGTIKYLRKNNVPIVFVVAKLAMDNGFEAQSFKAFIDDFFTTENEAYKEYSGSGNVKKANTQGRLVELTKGFIEYYNIDISETACLVGGSVENSEVSQEESTSEEVPADTSKNFVLFHLGVKNISQEEDTVYEVDCTDDDYLNKLGSRLAKENAQLFGVSFENDEEEPYSYSWEILEDMTEEEIKSKYGEIISVVPEEV